MAAMASEFEILRIEMTTGICSLNYMQDFGKQDLEWVTQVTACGDPHLGLLAPFRAVTWSQAPVLGRLDAHSETRCHKYHWLSRGMPLTHFAGIGPQRFWARSAGCFFEAKFRLVRAQDPVTPRHPSLYLVACTVAAVEAVEADFTP
jgi:hypothetical protein